MIPARVEAVRNINTAAEKINSIILHFATVKFILKPHMWRV